MSIFETLSKINVNEHTEKKNGLTYLPWAWAWGTLKSVYPASFYTVAENKDNWNYFTDGRTCWVKCAVTAVDGEESQTAVEYLPVMDFRNNAIPADQVTSVQVNKAVQRCLTKAIARLGLGLYIYAGEDLPEEQSAQEKPVNEKPTTQSVKPIPVVHIAANVNTAENTKPVTASKTRTATVKELCTTLGITQDQFGLLKKMAAWSNVISGAKVADLTDDEFDALIEFVTRNVELAEQPN